MAEFLDAAKGYMAYATRVEFNGKGEVVTEVAVAEIDESGKPVGGEVSRYSSNCSTAIEKYGQAWSQKIDDATVKSKNTPAQRQAINKANERKLEKAAKVVAQTCSPNGWQWQRTETEQMRPKQIRDEAELGGLMLTTADRSLFDAVKIDLTPEKPRVQVPDSALHGDPTVPRDE